MSEPLTLPFWVTPEEHAHALALYGLAYASEFGDVPTEAEHVVIDYHVPGLPREQAALIFKDLRGLIRVHIDLTEGVRKPHDVYPELRGYDLYGVAIDQSADDLETCMSRLLHPTPLTYIAYPAPEGGQ